MNKFELATQIVLKMMETNALSFKVHNAVNKDISELNDYNIEQVCKAYEMAYRAIQKSETGAFN